MKYLETYIMTWNPRKSKWHDFESCIEEIHTTGSLTRRWGAGARKYYKTPSRFFFIRVDVEPKGVMGSGYIFEDTLYDGAHWHKVDTKTKFISLTFDTLQPSPAISYDELLKLEVISTSSKKYGRTEWLSQQCGTRIINKKTLKKLEDIWHIRTLSEALPFKPPDRDEGKPYTKRSVAYERSKKARQDCLHHYGYICQVCKLDFNKVYGDIGREYIHVHHLEEISKLKKSHKVNGAKDMIPVCPNCHAMLHKETPPIKPKTMRNIMNQKSLGNSLLKLYQ